MMMKGDIVYCIMQVTYHLGPRRLNTAGDRRMKPRSWRRRH